MARAWSIPCPCHLPSGTHSTGGCWAPGLVWMGVENLTPSGFNHWTVQAMASHIPVCVENIETVIIVTNLQHQNSVNQKARLQVLLIASCLYVSSSKNWNKANSSSLSTGGLLCTYSTQTVDTFQGQIHLCLGYLHLRVCKFVQFIALTP